MAILTRDTTTSCQRLLLFTITIMLFLFVLGCAKKTTVILMADPDGHVGEVTVQSDKGSVEISKAAQSTVVAGKESVPSAPKILSAEDIDRQYSKILAALPDPPIHFILYFKRDTTVLTKESTALIPDVLRTIQERKSENISVIGHSDTVGDSGYNMQLSTRRAHAVTSLLIKNGVNRDSLKATSHGENNPLIKTPDNTLEPRNRRVEVVVR